MDLEQQKSEDLGAWMLLERTRGWDASSSEDSNEGVRLTSSSGTSLGETDLMRAWLAWSSMACLPCPSAGGQE